MNAAFDRATESPSATVAQWLGAQIRHLTGSYGTPAAVLALAAIPWSAWLVCRRVRHPALGHVLFWAVAGCLSPVVFHRHGFDHEFLWYAFTPVVILAGALAVAAVARRGRLVAVLLAAVLIGGAGWNTVAQHGRRDLRDLDVAARINARLDADTLLFAPYRGGPWFFYAEPWVIDHVVSLNTLAEMLAKLRAGELVVRRVAVLIHPGAPGYAELLERHDELGMRREDASGFELFMAER